MTFPTVLTNPAQANAPVVVNANFDAVKPGALFGKKAATTTGLTWGYFGGVMVVDGVLTTIADGTVALTLSATNYVEATRAGVVSANTTAFTAGRIPLYTLVCSASAVTTETECRAWVSPEYIAGRVSVAVTTADVTLSAAQARCDIINVTGALTGNRNLIVPDGPQSWCVTNNTSGAYTLTVKTTAGSGIAVTQGKAADLLADGTNVVLSNNDAAAIGAIDSDDVTYTPTTLADWDGSADPGDVEQALDQLAERVTDAEAVVATTPVLIQIACSDETTALTTGTAKVTFRAPYAFTLTDVRASVTTAPTGGTLLTVDVNEAGTTVLSTKLTFDASEKTTTTAATPRVISDSAIADDAEITIDIDAVGSTIAGAGLKVTLLGTKP